MLVEENKEDKENFSRQEENSSMKNLDLMKTYVSPLEHIQKDRSVFVFLFFFKF